MLSTRLFVQVDHCRCEERFFGSSDKLTIWEYRKLVLLVAVGVKGKTPPVVTEVPQTAEMDRGAAHPIQILFFGLWPVRRRPIFRDRRFGIGVNIAKLATEADIQVFISTLELLVGNCMDTLFDIALYCLRNLLTARIRIEYPLSSC